MKDKGTGRSAIVLNFGLWRTRRACGKRSGRSATGRREVQVMEGVGQGLEFLPATETKSGPRWKTLAGLRGVSGRFWGISWSKLRRYFESGQVCSAKNCGGDYVRLFHVEHSAGIVRPLREPTSGPPSSALCPFLSESARSDAIRVPPIRRFSDTGIFAEAFAIFHPSPNA
jgi:hypothetical protein